MTNYYVSVNRGIVRFFSPQSSIRQGDPISPFLFILVMEWPSKMLKKQGFTGEGFKIGRNLGPKLQYHICFMQMTTWSFVELRDPK